MKKSCLPLQFCLLAFAILFVYLRDMSPSDTEPSDTRKVLNWPLGIIITYVFIFVLLWTGADVLQKLPSLMTALWWWPGTLMPMPYLHLNSVIQHFISIQYWVNLLYFIIYANIIAKRLLPFSFSFSQSTQRNLSLWRFSFTLFYIETTAPSCKIY